MKGMNEPMKRIFALILAMLMLLSAGAFAEEAGNNGDLMIIRETQDGASDDYDGDGKTEALSFAAKLDEYGDGSFTIGVGDQTLSIDGCMALSGKVYALKLAFGSYYPPVGFWGTLFMANEFGPSDDPLTYCFFYTDGKLYNVGAIPSAPDAMSVNMDGLITTQVRAARIGTWSRPADYKLASGHDWSSDNAIAYYQMTEIPRDVYPMGMIVDLKIDLPLLASRYDADASATLKAGRQVVLAATDDCRWLCVSSLDGETSGWVKLTGATDTFTDGVVVNGQATDVNDVFGNILYAD